MFEEGKIVMTLHKTPEQTANEIRSEVNYLLKSREHVYTCNCEPCREGQVQRIAFAIQSERFRYDKVEKEKSKMIIKIKSNKLKRKKK